MSALAIEIDPGNLSRASSMIGLPSAPIQSCWASSASSTSAPAEPLGVRDLAVDEIESLMRVCRDLESHHQGPGKGPRLRPHVLRIPAVKSHLFVHLAHHALLQRFTGLDESGQRREPALGPLRLSAEQDLVGAIVDDGDDRRIRSGELLAATDGVAADPAAFRRFCRIAVDRRKTG